MAGAVKVYRQVGRPSKIEEALATWATYIAVVTQYYQQSLDFVATGSSLDEYAVIIKKNNVQLIMADYIKYQMEGRGRQPGGGMAPIKDLVEWLEVKGIKPDDEDMSLQSLAYLIARKQQREGNAVYRGEREGIPIEDIIQQSFDEIKNEVAEEIALQVATEVFANIQLFEE